MALSLNGRQWVEHALRDEDSFDPRLRSNGHEVGAIGSLGNESNGGLEELGNTRGRPGDGDRQ